MPFDPNSVATIRDHLGLSRNRLSRELGCSPQSIYNWESGISSPTYDNLDKIHTICRDHQYNDHPPFWVPPK